MQAVSIIVIIAIAITYLQGRVVSDKIHLNFFLLATILLIGFFGIRVDYGNDYPVYKEIFELFGTHGFATAAYGSLEGVGVERGWALLNYLFAPLGWHFFIFVLTIVQFGTIYWFLQKYVPPRYQWLALAFYLLNPALMLTELSMLRQSLAMSIYLWTVPWILQKKWIRAGIVILIAATIHTSCLCMLPTLLFPYMTVKHPTRWIIWFVGIVLALKFIDSFAGGIIGFVLQNDALARYEKYVLRETDNVEGSGVVVMLQVVIATSLLWITTKHNDNRRRYMFFTLVYCAAVIMIPFSYIVPLSARIGLYFTQLSLITYILLAQYAKRHKFALILLTLIFCVMIYDFVGHFSSITYGPYYSVYHTILG